MSRRIIACVATGLGVLVAGALTILAVLMIVVPFIMGAQTYTVLTGSMQPSIAPGTLIGARPTEADGIRVGDVVTYQLHSGSPTLVTHRVVGAGARADGEVVFSTQGDANNVQDAVAVTAEQIRGVVVYAVPYLGYLQTALDGRVKAIAAVGLGVVAVLWGGWVLASERRRRRLGRVAAAAATVFVLATAGVVATSPPASAAVASARDSGGDTGILVSADGRTWSTKSCAIIDLSGVVPGDLVKVGFWAKNFSTTAGAYDVALRWVAQHREHPADVALAAALTTPSFESRRIVVGEAQFIELLVEFTPTPGADTRNADVLLVVTVDGVAWQGAPEAPSDGSGAAGDPDDPGGSGGSGANEAGNAVDASGLATTGGELSGIAIVGAIVLSGLGVVLFFSARRAATPSPRRLREGRLPRPRTPHR